VPAWPSGRRRCCRLVRHSPVWSGHKPHAAHAVDRRSSRPPQRDRSPWCSVRDRSLHERVGQRRAVEAHSSPHCSAVVADPSPQRAKRTPQKRPQRTNTKLCFLCVSVVFLSGLGVSLLPLTEPHNQRCPPPPGRIDCPSPADGACHWSSAKQLVHRPPTDQLGVDVDRRRRRVHADHAATVFARHQLRVAGRPAPRSPGGSRQTMAVVRRPVLTTAVRPGRGLNCGHHPPPARTLSRRSGNCHSDGWPRKAVRGASPLGVPVKLASRFRR